MNRPVEHLVLMGVAGCGKTTAADNLHRALGWPVAEADEFHPRRQHRQDEPGRPPDRRGPVAVVGIHARLDERARRRGVKTIVTCSALKRSYRDLLSRADGRVFFIHLIAQPDELRERMSQREGHFMPSALLPSQFADLEPLADGEDGVTVASRATPEETFDAILAALEHASTAA